MVVMLRDNAWNAPDPAQNNLWAVMIPTSGAVKFLLAESMTATFYKTPAEGHFCDGSNIFYPGTADIDSLSITFYETHDYQVSQWLRTWQLEVFNPQTGVYGYPSVFKKTIYVNMFSRASTKPTHVIKYYGCWPSDKSPFELNYADETGVTTITANFSVDDVVY